MRITWQLLPTVKNSMVTAPVRKWLSWSFNIIFPKNQYKEKAKSAAIAAALVILAVALTYVDYGNQTAKGNWGAYASSFGILIISLMYYGRGRA